MEKHKNGTNDPRLDKKMPEIIAAVKAHNIPEVRRLVESCGLEWKDNSFHQYDIKEVNMAIVKCLKGLRLRARALRNKYPTVEETSAQIQNIIKGKK